MPDPIQLTLYANGIFLFNGPFRPFTEVTTQTFLQDVLDGYFPSELQKRYPDGVPFNVRAITLTMLRIKIIQLGQIA